MSIEFQNAIPKSLVAEAPVSTSKTILRKELIEIYPQDTTTYAFGNNDAIKFKVGSNQGFINLKESYVRFKMKVYGSESKNTASYRFERAGLDAMWQRCSAYLLSTGQQLQMYQQYNRWCSIQNAVYADRLGKDVESSNLLRGAMPLASNPLGNPQWELVADGVNTAAETTNAASVFTFKVSPNYLAAVVEINDEVKIDYSTYSTVYGRVIAIDADKANAGAFFTVTLNTTYSTDVASVAANASVYVRKSKNQGIHSDHLPAMGADSAAAISQTYVWKPRMTIMDHVIPGFLLKGGGIEFRFELDDLNKAFIKPNYTGLTFEISEPRFLAMIETPHPDIVEEYISDWKSETGLIYSIPSVRVRRQTSSSTASDSLMSHPGVRSARTVFTTHQLSGLHDSSSDNNGSIPQLSTFVRGYISEFQYRVGSHQFPRRPVVCDSFSREALLQLSMNTRSPALNFTIGEFASHLNYVQSLPAISGDLGDNFILDASKFIMSGDLSRDNTDSGHLTGMDLSIVPLDLVIERESGYAYAGLAGSPMYFHYILHDAYLILSQRQTVTLN